MKKRILVVLFTIAMIIVMIPMTAMTVFAGGNFVEIVETGNPYSGVRAAVDAATNGQTIRLNAACTENVTIPEGKSVTIDLNGKVLKGNGNGSVITVINGASLTLTDSAPDAEHVGYKDADGLWHLGNTVPEGCTAKTIKGGIITGGNSATNGGGVYVSGTFNMFGGTIVGNKADYGGGVSNSTGTFTMSGGMITCNTAINGGGVYAAFNNILGKGVNILVGGDIIGNAATVGGGVYVKEEECFAAGTPITMADGSRKPIETLEIGDLVRVFDHESGALSTAKLFDVWKYPEKHSGVVTLHFSHDIDVTVVYGHSFFDREANKYVSVSRDNVSSYVGHEFYNADDGRWETLNGYDFLDGEVDTYVITSEKHLNCVANGMLSNEDGFYTMLTNIFEYGDGLKIDAEKKASDIEKYGLWGFENLKCASMETYEMLNLQYLNVAFGKGMITPEEFAYLESFWTGVDPELFCEEDEEKEENKPALRKMLLGAAPSEPDVPAPTVPGIYVGGSLKITGNDSGNLYVSSGKTITVGTGTAKGGNGVAAPTEALKIGVTMQTPGQFTTNGTSDDKDYFTSDDPDYKVKYNTSGYLELLSAVVKIYGQSLVLIDDEASGSVSVRYYIDIAEENLDRFTFSYTFKGKTNPVTLSETRTISEKTYYVIDIPVNVKEFADEIVLTVKDTEKFFADDVIGYSVKTYCDNKIASEEASEELKDLCKVLLDLGSAMQTYKGYNTENLANDGSYTVALEEVPETLNAYETVGTVEGIKVFGKTVSLNDTTSIVIYFELAEGKNISDYEFKAAGETLTPEKSGNLYKVAIKGIGPMDFDKPYTVTVENGESMEITYSVLSYAEEMQDIFNESLANIAKLLYQYYKAVNKCFEN